MSVSLAIKRVPYQTDQNHPAIQEYKAAVEKGKKNQHIFPERDGWIIKNLWTGEISKHFTTKKEALEKAEMLARADNNSIFIHGTDGRIIERKDF
ncbi:MAG TPA: DUF2188 domain-containing protein [Methylomirabilota bacterium]|nr:DUF2188 domain-containing protein [Methylomirabilota bacterium]